MRPRLREQAGRARWPEAVRDFVRTRVVEFRGGNGLDLYDNGRDGLAAMLEAVQRAETSIDLETYILRSDLTGRRFVNALAERARAGVTVRVIIDAFGSHLLDRRTLEPLQRAGAQVREFNPIATAFWARLLRRRDHRKLLVVDGRIGFVGGLNIGDEYAAEVAGTPAWRDAHARVAGPITGDLSALFEETWQRCGGRSSAEEPSAARPVAHSGQHRCALLADGPTYGRRRMRDLVVSGLGGARERVLLVSPYFAPGRSVLDALERAATRGVRVEIVIAGRSDHPIFRRAARRIVPRLLARGVLVYEDVERMVHAKVATFDDELAIIGTSNLDRQSLEHSYEVNLLVEGSETTRWLREHFDPQHGGARPIDRASLAARGLTARAIDLAAAALVRLT